MTFNILKGIQVRPLTKKELRLRGLKKYYATKKIYGEPVSYEPVGFPLDDGCGNHINDWI